MSPTRDLIAYNSIKRIEGAALTEVSFIDSAGHTVYPSIRHPLGGPGFSNGMVAWSPDGQRVVVVQQQANVQARIWLADPTLADQRQANRAASRTPYSRHNLDA